MLKQNDNNSEYLRILITDVYRGHPDERLWRFSGAERHLDSEISKSAFENCPLWSVLGLLHKSSMADTRNAAKKGFLHQDPVLVEYEEEEDTEEEEEEEDEEEKEREAKEEEDDDDMISFKIKLWLKLYFFSKLGGILQIYI